MEASKFGIVSQIVLLPGKSYSFIKCKSTEDSIKIYEGMNANAKLGQNGAVLYLLYCENVPVVENTWNRQLPPELILVPEFITELEEELLVNRVTDDFPIDETSTLDSGALKHRKAYHYGYEFKYDTNNVDAAKPLTKKIPNQCNGFWLRLKSILPHLTFSTPDQATVNEYQAGQGIPPHCDTHSQTMDTRFQYGYPDGSLLVMSEESRYGWTHGITPRKMDIIPMEDGLTAIERKRRISFTFRSLKFDECRCVLTAIERKWRISFTFRSLKFDECRCVFPSLCDTHQKHQRDAVENTEKLTLASEIELKNVHKRRTCPENTTAYKTSKCSEQLSGIFVLFGVRLRAPYDLGEQNNDLPSAEIYEITFSIQIGCDRSHCLLNVCRQRGFNIFQCDCLHLPIKSDSVDGCISIAVIHHLVTKDRRHQAITEMARILVTGGRGLIYVWAKNQAKDTQSSYLRQNKRNKKNDVPVDGSSNKVEFVDGLPVHTNRTQFMHSDMLVPWKLKDDSSEQKEETFLRFYHVFEENELLEMCQQISSIKVIDTYYDQGNWCVIFEKN